MAGVLLMPQDASSATFNVSSTMCGGGAGTLSQAVRDANANPGPDIIEIAAGLIIKADCDMQISLGDGSLLILESVTIRGNGSTIHGANLYIEKSGVINRLDTGDSCPLNDGNYIVGGRTDLIFQVGTRSADNSGVELTLENLIVDNASALVTVRDNAKATLRDVSAIDIRDLTNCARPAIQAFGGGELTLERVTITRSTDFNAILPSGIVAAATGKIEVYDSDFTLNPYRYAIVSTGDADIVSSRFTDSGGIQLTGAGTVRVINSLFNQATVSGLTRRYQDAFLAVSGAIEFVASTVIFGSNNCPPPSSRDCFWTPSLPSVAAFVANAGTFSFQQSAVHVQTIGAVFNPGATPILEAVNGGSFSADALTFIQPVAWQDATALQSITSQAGLVTGPDALPVTDTGIGTVFDAPDSVTPIVTGNATLVDRVANAGVGEANELQDPRGNMITEDVYGAPRTIGSLRNIGAIQNDLVPKLIAKLDPASTITADLTWNKPLAAGLTGYDLCTGTGTPPASLERTLNACPGTLVEPFATPDTTTSGSFSSIPPSNGNQWFVIRAVAGPNKEPWSNVENIAIPLTVTYPTTTPIGAGTVVSPTTVGPGAGASYLLLSGMLPTGLALNPSTGVISGTPTGICMPATVGILVVAANGRLTNTGTSFTCPATPVPVLPTPALILLLTMLLGFGLTGIRAVNSSP